MKIKARHYIRIFLNFKRYGFIGLLVFLLTACSSSYFRSREDKTWHNVYNQFMVLESERMETFDALRDKQNVNYNTENSSEELNKMETLDSLGDEQNDNNDLRKNSINLDSEEWGF